MNCRICDGPARFRFRLGPYQIVKCSRCGFGWPEPMPTEGELREMYSCCHHGHAARDDLSNTKERVRVAHTIRRLAPEARTLLDVGCGFGHSLDAARETGFETYGVEPDAQRASVAASKGHFIEVGVLRPGLFGGMRSDAVILNHVIEHLIDPVRVVLQVREVLVDGGLLFVGCPNFRSPRARLTGQHYDHVCPPEHISYFGERSLRLVMGKTGFEEIRIERFTHTLHVKELLAYYMHLEFLRPRRYESPFEGGRTVRRFTDGRARALKVAVCAGIIAVSWALRPFMNALGGDQIESYWRKA